MAQKQFVAETKYKALTKQAFALPETVTVASLIAQGTAPDEIRRQGAYLKVRGGVGSGVRNGGKEIIKTIISPS